MTQHAITRLAALAVAIYIIIAIGRILWITAHAPGGLWRWVSPAGLGMLGLVVVVVVYVILRK